jgi:hypothetical protein
VPPETSTHSPWSSLVHYSARQARARARAQALTFSIPAVSIRPLGDSITTSTHWPFDSQIHRSSHQLGVLVPGQDQTKPNKPPSPSQSPKAVASQHPATNVWTFNRRLQVRLQVPDHYPRLVYAHAQASPSQSEARPRARGKGTLPCRIKKVD